MGKGDRYRLIDREKYNKNFDRIFRGIESETPTATQIECAAIVKHIGAPWPIIKEPDLTKMDHPMACKYLVEGMRVKLIRRADNSEKGWNNHWISEMDKYIGSIYTITRIDKDKGVSFKEAGCRYPAFCLQIIEQEK